MNACPMAEPATSSDGHRARWLVLELSPHVARANGYAHNDLNG